MHLTFDAAATAAAVMPIDKPAAVLSLLLCSVVVLVLETVNAWKMSDNTWRLHLPLIFD